MNGETVADITINAVDQTGKQVKFIFSKVAATYAIYSNEDRVVVQYADDPTKADEQRRTVAFLAPVRGEINGLIEDWRDHRWAIYRAKAQRYDRRTADALVVALQGDGETAKKLLQAVRNDILDERSSLGRVHYVGWAFAAGLAVVVLSWLLASLLSWVGAPATTAGVGAIDPVLSSSIGCLGALFSIAIAIRGRSVQTDLRFRDNLLDAVLRMLIGAISAFLLLLLFQSRIIVLSLGELGEVGSGKGGGIHAAEIVVAFLAGFSERLVGNLLDNKLIPGLTREGDTRVDEATRDTLAKPDKAEPSGDAPDLPVPSLADPLSAADADGDRSITDVEIDDIDLTSDSDLPPATGGVEKSAG